MAARGFLLVASFCILLGCSTVANAEDSEDLPEVEADVGKSQEGSRTDDEVVTREEEAIQIDGLNASQMKQLREQADKHKFQAEVNRMMKLIINSLYRNKEIFLRELISNSSDALDKIRLLSLTEPDALKETEELSIKIKVDKDNSIIHVTDTGIGMTKQHLINNLGTIAKSGTSEFFEKMSEVNSNSQAVSDLIGQFGVGFYSSFLVADKVVVTSKHNDGSQHIWESDSESFAVAEDPRGNTLGRGTTVSLYLKEEASDYLEIDTIRDLIKKYSQFINFPIYLWASKTVTEEVPDEEAEEAKEDQEEIKEDEDEAEVEEESDDEKKPKTKTVEKTVWDWELLNETKPIWQRPVKEISDEEYKDFYQAIAKESSDPLTKTHFVAEGEVSFKSVLFIPGAPPRDMFQDYGQKKVDHIKVRILIQYSSCLQESSNPIAHTHFVAEGEVSFRCLLYVPEIAPKVSYVEGNRLSHVKMYVRRVFITDDFQDMMPKYLQFVRGVVDSDDLPLNVSRETLQQHKLLKVIKKKLIRKVLDMIKKIPTDQYMEKFWAKYGTNMKLGIMEDHSNRTRLAKLLRFYSSNSESDLTSLEEYIERMKEKQEKIYFCAGNGRKEVEDSPFVERLLKRGYEVLYLTEPVDEYTIQALPEFDGKRFQNVAKEGLGLDESEKAKERKEAVEKEFKPLADWLKETALVDQIEKAVITERLTDSPCALVASQYGWSGNMERIMKAQAYKSATDTSQDFYAKQKKILEINPRHPLIKNLLERVEVDAEDIQAKSIAQVMFDAAVLRSGYALKDSAMFSKRILEMLYKNLDLDPDTPVEEEPVDEKDEDEEEEEEVDADGEEEEDDDDDDDDDVEKEEAHDEL